MTRVAAVDWLIFAGVYWLLLPLTGVYWLLLPFMEWLACVVVTIQLTLTPGIIQLSRVLAS